MVQRRRHQEIVNAANARMTPSKMMKALDDKEVLGLSHAIRDLTLAERKMRTVLWAALQTTISPIETTTIEAAIDIGDENCTTIQKDHTQVNENRSDPEEDEA